MDIRLNPKIKRVLLIVLIFIALCLCANTNNNPNPIIQRIFRPIHFGGGGTFYYAGLISILIIYYSLKALNKEKDYRVIDTRFKRIIVTILLISIFPTCFQGVVKTCKGFSNDLNSIYLYRKDAKVYTWTSENESHVVCRLDLQNCSKKTQSFYVKVRLPSIFKGVAETTYVSNKMLTLESHERTQFEIPLYEIPLYEGNMNSSFSCNKFEFSLYNNQDEVRFTPSAL